ncbi:MAG: DUF2116 family Zn-ribbon domain-containing protein [Candidatus Bathyarchaeia archaeon]
MKKYDEEENKYAVLKHHHCQIYEAPAPMDKKFCSEKARKGII